MYKKLANAILESMRIHHESYDHAAADAQEKFNENEKLTSASPFAGLGTDWASFYTKTMLQACDEACASKQAHRMPGTLAPCVQHALLDVERC